MKYEKLFSKTSKIMKPSEIRKLLKWVTQKDIISFGGGIPDPKNIPKEELAELTKKIILEYGEQALIYGPTRGNDILIKEVIKFMDKNSIKVKSEEQVVILTGSQQGLDLWARIFLNQKDIVFVELPTYLAALNAFTPFQPNIIGIPLDENGMKIDVLEGKVKENIRRKNKIKFIYTIPTCQNPSGYSMSLDRRKYLLEVASRYDLLILEDDPYSYFLYENVEATPLKAMDKEDRVVFMSTFSKMLAPGLRVGWMIGNEEIINKIILAKEIADLCTSPLSQYIAAEALRIGLIEKHLPIIREIYKEKRNVMIQALETYMPKESKWVKPVGGMFMFIWAPENVDTELIAQKAIEKYKVAYVPGRPFYVDGSVRNAIRLNFTYPSKEQIVEGVNRLSQVIKGE
ncbi:MAG: PLP-dependent aminotransferase family protein [Candidatus Methanomethylicia archaeon]|nr:PLP-dependent aminotransferase family protein [Candidatus Methanomethylicia archaeon]